MVENAAATSRRAADGDRSRRLLVIEPEGRLRHVLQLALSARGYTVLEAATGSDGLWVAAQQRPDLVIAALELPDMNGQDLTQQLRTWSGAPIVLLAAWGQEREVVAALDAGADDYVWQPFSMGDLTRRVGGVLRRSSANGASSWQAGSLRIDLQAEQAWLDDRELQLTPIEYALLATLARHGGTIVTPRQLLNAVGNLDGTAQRHHLPQHLATLRRKVERDPLWPRYLVAEPGVGYRLRIDGVSDG